jgi:pimeloyl-ACP methyl ester carboxylesterase
VKAPARDEVIHDLICDDVGDPGGAPVLYFHGGGDSRLTRHPDDSIAAALGIRLVAVERSRLVDRRRTLVSSARSVGVLADGLGIDRFAVLGWSAGGPHALATAAELPDRVTRAAVVAGMPEPPGLRAMPRDTQNVIRLARISPRLAARPLGRWGRRQVAPTGDPDCDRAYAAGRVEAFRDGARWLALELRLLGRPWGVDLAAVRAPVTLWYGERDRVTPVSIGRDLERALPNADLRVVGDGHQLLFTRWREILEDLRRAPLVSNA